MSDSTCDSSGPLCSNLKSQVSTISTMSMVLGATKWQALQPFMASYAADEDKRFSVVGKLLTEEIGVASSSLGLRPVTSST